MKLHPYTSNRHSCAAFPLPYSYQEARPRAGDLQPVGRRDPPVRRSPTTAPGPSGARPPPLRPGRGKGSALTRQPRSPLPCGPLTPSLRPALRGGKRLGAAGSRSLLPPPPPQAPALTSRPWSDRTRTDTAPKCFSRSSFSAAVSSAGRCRTSSVRPRRRATPG